MKRTLVDLQKAIKGTVVMSMELEKMFICFMNKKVPENWEKVSYLSLKPLGSWVEDLVLRLQFFKKWLESGSLDTYWISSFFFPQGSLSLLSSFLFSSRLHDRHTANLLQEQKNRHRHPRLPLHY